jgi:hypothetical protein
MGAPPEFWIAKQVSTKMWSAPHIGGIWVMRLPDAAVLRCASHRPADTGCMAEIGLRGIYPGVIPLQELPVHGVNRCLKCHPKFERRRRSGHSEKWKWHFFVDSPACRAVTG